MGIEFESPFSEELIRIARIHHGRLDLVLNNQGEFATLATPEALANTEPTSAPRTALPACPSGRRAGRQVFYRPNNPIPTQSACTELVEV